MITQRVLHQTLADISYKDCHDGFDRVVSGFRYGRMGDGFFIQHWQMLPDCNTGVEEEQRGRKWYISSHASVGELVQSALMAVLVFEEHEAREGFEFRGRRLYGPHINISALYSASQEKERRDETNYADNGRAHGSAVL